MAHGRFQVARCCCDLCPTSYESSRSDDFSSYGVIGDVASAGYSLSGAIGSQSLSGGVVDIGVDWSGTFPFDRAGLLRAVNLDYRSFSSMSFELTIDTMPASSAKLFFAKRQFVPLTSSVVYRQLFGVEITATQFRFVLFETPQSYQSFVFSDGDKLKLSISNISSPSPNNLSGDVEFHRNGTLIDSTSGSGIGLGFCDMQYGIHESENAEISNWDFTATA